MGVCSLKIHFVGTFVSVALEMAAAARAQAAGGQEFADYSTNLGVGTYSGQVQPLQLPLIDPDLNGFEGGYVSANCVYLLFFTEFILFYLRL